ncbi:mandelate racemase/muconate lactonizing enzyme family protein [Paenibacillus harenae]|uniref:mandelate racemase/muconate lactonizing enzyme family protein n=1 Tax=Paenibacillus harenae TaxID=306543 RepID=UPI00278E42CB|nr:mandelate racemase/muconate lactonizing enzyme family protein [Paenibacillus harenae]MDQ0058084.1 D-galactarolactone cycloisomerase [Paenibacillus harenae]
MLIRNIDTYPLYYSIAQPYGDANGIKSYRTAFYIRITTDSGIDGWGECIDWLPTLQKGFDERIIPFLIGKKATERTRLVQTVAKWHSRAASAVSMALTEIFAKSCGISICDLWGGKLRDTVLVYASFQSYSEHSDWRKQSLHAIEEAVQTGFEHIKLKIGGKTVKEDQKHIREAQSLLQGEVKIALDANGSYDLSTACRWNPEFEQFSNIMWLEEPLPIQETFNYGLLRQRLALPIAGGEDMKLASDFLPLLTHQSLDIVTPDMLHLTGMDEYWAVLSMANCYGVRTSPHAYDGALTRLYAMFAQACLVPWSKMKPEQVDPVEWDVMDNPFTELIPLRPSQGEVAIPDGTGIGVDLDMEKLHYYKWDGSSYE